MQLLLDFFPIIAFFAVFQVAEHHPGLIPDALLDFFSNTGADVLPIVLATVVAIAATLVQLGIYVAMKKKIAVTFWLTLFIIIVFGGLTIYFQDGRFIQWKPTILYWLFAAMLLFARLTRRNWIEKAFSKAEIVMAEHDWQTLQTLWIGFMFALGAINLAVVYTMSVEAWVNFKLYGLFALTFVFTIASAVFITKHADMEQN